ncbi:hypothetical protein ACJ5H2_11005 [Nocardioides sp. R1-1]|uniref:hypothetical protein n=1 Tax=Nocardioides sp. R1-1 TaxID=3383502 RepID=UPI0038CFB208
MTTRAGRIHLAGLLTLLGVACGACSGGDGGGTGGGATPDPSAPLTEITVECDQFADTAQRISDAQVALYDGKASSDDAAAVDALVAELEALEEDAPADVRTALSDLGAGFRSVQEALERPSAEASAELVELAPALAEDSQAVTTWIVEECGR